MFPRYYNDSASASAGTQPPDKRAAAAGRPKKAPEEGSQAYAKQQTLLLKTAVVEFLVGCLKEGGAGFCVSELYEVVQAVFVDPPSIQTVGKLLKNRGGIHEPKPVRVITSHNNVKAIPAVGLVDLEDKQVLGGVVQLLVQAQTNAIKLNGSLLQHLGPRTEALTASANENYDSGAIKAFLK